MKNPTWNVNPQQLYESVRNRQEHLGNWGQCNFAREISTLFPGYFLTFLEAWGQGNIADDVRIFSESFNLQSVNYSLRFYVFSLPANVIYRIREAIGDFKQDYGRVKYGDWKYFFPPPVNASSQRV